MEPTPGKAFYQRQIAALETRDLDALPRQYHPDASTIGFDFTVKGHAVSARISQATSSVWAR